MCRTTYPLSHVGLSTNSIRLRYHKYHYRNRRRMQISSSLSVSFDEVNTESFHILPNSNLSIVFRFLRPGDQSEVKTLCQDWFPIEYPDKWYDDIVQNKKYFALAACDTHTQNIVGIIVANILLLGHCNREDQQILNRNFTFTTSACYILTLGVIKQYRRQGLASILFENLLTTLTKYDTCKVIYLHVLFSNKQAIEFYESKLFQCRVHLPAYYLIKHEYLDAYCFARYINGGYPPYTFSGFLSNTWTCLMRANPCHLLYTIRNFVKNKFLDTNSYQRASSYKQISHII
ncbi:unnamed protein product [Rotaria socialis]|uniref:N-alpha-acetyltransferase 60 n=1 Tax=Rotaria socialis TaxID=392032 RepID=A0A818CUN6_9BILA|nr:unnamed protein product [Rotaria socialis]CAF3432691.1 unnamed protein product [Rotaria socialis]CAF4515580.1 unnamed protein product [Rotaria socialis]